MRLVGILLVVSVFSTACAMETGEPSSSDPQRPGEIVSLGTGTPTREGSSLTPTSAAPVRGGLGAGGNVGPANPQPQGSRVPGGNPGAGSGGYPPPGASSDPNPSPWTDLNGLQVVEGAGRQ